jgi:hypothetical protein
MCVLIFSTNFVWNIFEFKKISGRYYNKCAYLLIWSSRYTCQILIKPEFSRKGFEKCSNITFRENLPRGNRVIPWGETDKTKPIVAFQNNGPRLKKNWHPTFVVNKHENKWKLRKNANNSMWRKLRESQETTTEWRDRNECRKIPIM